MSIRRVLGQVRKSFSMASEADGKMSRTSHWVQKEGDWRLTYDDGGEAALMYSKHERIPMKDFEAEVRATLDIQLLLQKAVLLLDVQETSMEGIVNLLVEKVLSQDETFCSVAEVQSVLFTNNAGNLLARTIQGTSVSEKGYFEHDESWICALGNVPSLQKRHVAIARLKQPINLGTSSTQVRFFILVLCPSKEKSTKCSLETGKTFATIFADIEFRQELVGAATEDDFKSLLVLQSRVVTQYQTYENGSNLTKTIEDAEKVDLGDPGDSNRKSKYKFARGLREDLGRRLPHYVSDFRDGIFGDKALQKTISTTFFLYFACLLPAIAFGVLNDQNTNGKIDVIRTLMGQVIGGLFWTFFSGQHLLVQLTTAPLAIYIKVIFYISEDFGLDFYALYCAVGLWCSFFLVLYSVFDVSKLMKWSTRSTEEIFALFITIAFCHDAFTDVKKNFDANYNSGACQVESAIQANISQQEFGSYNILPNNISAASALTFSLQNQTSNLTLFVEQASNCARENSILFLLLMFGTLWLGLLLYNFNKTPYLNANKREILADYALPVAVVVFSFIGSLGFRDVKLKSEIQEIESTEYSSMFQVAPLETLPVSAIFAAMGLGFCLSMLIFMDQNIGSAMVNNPGNKLKKGIAYHLDLLAVAIMNSFLSIFGLPWMHACIPHSPLHVRSLADVEERVDQGHVHEIIVKVRETRLTSLFPNILIGLSLFLVPYPLGYIPTAVLDGLFLYMALTALIGNQMFERITLLFTEQAAYPPNHYIRRVPQRSIHKFTGLQILQLLVLCVFGFSPLPYMKMMFPLLLILLLPIRHRLVPLVIDRKYLAALDGQHQ